jgi:hypothetical protein
MLITTPNLGDPDGLFEALMEAHRGLDDAASRRFDARLVLILANHIGSPDVLRAAIALAQEDGAAPPPD